MFAINRENLKKLYIFLKIHLSIVYSKCGHEYEKIFKEKYQKFLISLLI